MSSTQVPSASDVKPILLALNAGALVETLFYGIHFVLFCISMFILVRNRRRAQCFILVSAFVMFALSTADISITIRLMTHDIAAALDQGSNMTSNDYPSLAKPTYQKDLIFVTNNLIAELTLLYRCYMVWSRSKYLLILASFLVLCDTVLGYLSNGPYLLPPYEKFVPVYLWSVFAINIAISGIAIGRIFWVSQIARPILGHRNIRHLYMIIAVLLESSVVYSACLLLYLTFPPGTLRQFVMTAIGMRVVAIMPTLLIVQIGLLVDRTAGDPSSDATPAVVLDTIIATTHEV